MSRERETPITNDFCVSEGLGDAEPEEAFRALLSHARRMERDRAALMEALEAVMEELNHAYKGIVGLPESHPALIRYREGRAALSAARGEK